jgi:hypothetical protein
VNKSLIDLVLDDFRVDVGLNREDLLMIIRKMAERIAEQDTDLFDLREQILDLEPK